MKIRLLLKNIPQTPERFCNTIDNTHSIMSDKTIDYLSEIEVDFLKKEDEIFVKVKDYDNYYISNLARLYNSKTGRFSAGSTDKRCGGYVKVKLTKMVRQLVIHFIVWWLCILFRIP